MQANIRIKLNEKIYLRDPEDTGLGRKIISHAVKMIDEIGFESFTFKKLATEISSTEASIYRYFENKHKLLVYLVSWYWNWLDFRIAFQTNNVNDVKEKLKIIIQVISESDREDPQFMHLNEGALHRIVIAESSKAYFTKEVDSNNKDGLFRDYKNLCKKIAAVVLEYNPSYKYPHSIISTLIETSHHQRFFAIHLPSLTDVNKNNQTGLAEYLEHLLFSAIDPQD